MRGRYHAVDRRPPRPARGPRHVGEAALRDQAARRNLLVASTDSVPTADEDPVLLEIAGAFVRPSAPRRRPSGGAAAAPAQRPAES